MMVQLLRARCNAAHEGNSIQETFELESAANSFCAFRPFRDGFQLKLDLFGVQEGHNFNLVFGFASKMWRRILVFHHETHLDGHLPVMHLALLDVAARFHHLKPAQVLDRLVRAFDRLLHRILNGGGGGSGEFDEFINGIFHKR